MKLKDLADLIFPNYCIICGKAISESYERYLCLHCYGNLPLYLYGIGKDSPIQKAFWGRCEISFGASYMIYQSGSDYAQILKEIKYRERPDLALFFGRNFGYRLRQLHFTEISQIDAWFPVPMTKRKQRSRGYNQAALIAQGLSDVTKIPMIENLLLRTKDRSTQTKMGRFDRWLNAKSVYHCNKLPERYQHIAIIDDVLTTGATIEACIDAIRKQGPIQISVFTLAYTRSL